MIGVLAPCAPDDRRHAPTTVLFLHFSGLVTASGGLTLPNTDSPIACQTSTLLRLNMVQFGQTWPGNDQFWPDQIRPGIAHSWPEFDHVRPTIARNRWQHFRSRPALARNWPNSTQTGMGLTIICPTSPACPDVGQSNLGRLKPALLALPAVLPTGRTAAPSPAPPAAGGCEDPEGDGGGRRTCEASE